MFIRKKSTYSAAVYLRLSRDDGDKAESDSIQNQRELIRDFITNHPEIETSKEFVDDGYSGTNFERPGFIRMMSDIEGGRIDCVIVKDLSRLGRNYIETGKYLERIFPMHGVRVLAINDNYDSTNESSDADQILIPFKNLINDAYCRDISMKIRSQLDIKRKNGQFIGSFAAYGYMKDPKNKNHLLIDEYAANIVRMIFNMKLEGYSAGTIAEHLNEIKVLTPMEYKRFCGLNYNGGFQISTNPVWHPNTVTRILKNEVYLGIVVQGKNRKINYKVKESRAIEPSKWIRVPNAHEPIIPKEIFDTVQKMLMLETRTSPNKKQVDVLSGLVRCGDCGQNMVIRCSSKNGKKYFYYHCNTNKSGEGCSSHLISSEKLQEMVLWQIRQQIETLVNAEEIIRTASNLPNELFKVKFLDEQICKLKTEIDKYSELSIKLYQDLKNDVVSQEEYKELLNRFNRKTAEARCSLEEIEAKKKGLSLKGLCEQQWLKDLKQYRNITTLDRKIATALLEKIIVFSKDRIELQFRYMDEMEILLAAAESQISRSQGREIAI